MALADILRKRNPALYPEAQTPEQGGAVQVAQASPELMKGAKQIADVVEALMPSVEQITGLTRRDFFLALLKSGFKGNMGNFVDTLMGRQPDKPSRFEKQIRIAAIWIPVGIGLLVLLVGGAYIAVVLLLKVVSVI